MLQPLFKIAILAIFLIIIAENSAVSAASVCEDVKVCEQNYTKLESLVDTRNTELHRIFTVFLGRLKKITQLRRLIKKYTYELDNPCNFMPLNGLEVYWPYLMCKWLGYNYNDCVSYVISNAPYKENLPPLILVDDCAQSLEICTNAIEHVKSYNARKDFLSQQMDRVVNNDLISSLTRKVSQLELQFKNRSKIFATSCPQDDSELYDCEFVIRCTRQYQLKQQELEVVLKQKYLQYAKLYEEQGKQLKLKERLAVLIKQNSTEFGHCAIRPSSARNFSSPYEGMFYYAYKYLHMPPSFCTTANKNLLPIPGNRNCNIMTESCKDKVREANETIRKEKEDLKCFSDLVANQTAYTESLKKLITNLEKDVQKKINSHSCFKCIDTVPCNKEYLDLQRNLNEINQNIQNEYLKKFEREDKKAVIREKFARMVFKIDNKCDIVPVSTFQYVYPANRCYWSDYLMGISLEKSIHTFTPNFDKLPDLTQVIEVTKNCTVTVAECRRRLADGNILLTSRQIELEKLRKENKDDDISKYEATLRDKEQEYQEYADLFCYGPTNDVNCTESLIACKKAYIASQERLDDARSMFYKGITEYQEHSGILEKWTSVDADLNTQLRARCVTVPEIPREIVRRPYLAPHEDASNYKLSQLDYLLAHGPNNTGLVNCTDLLKTCNQQLQAADRMINNFKRSAKSYYELNKGVCTATQLMEHGIVKKIMALRELSEQNKHCHRVGDGFSNRIYYFYDQILM